jgi:hypothetical protein
MPRAATHLTYAQYLYAGIDLCQQEGGINLCFFCVFQLNDTKMPPWVASISHGQQFVSLLPLLHGNHLCFLVFLS